MKIFSSLMAFVMIFAVFATVYADVAPYPRPRPRPESQIVTAQVNNNDELTIQISFPDTCDYKYKIFDASGELVKSGKDFREAGDTADIVVYSDDKFVAGEKKFYVLKLTLFDIREETRFGEKIKRGEKNFTKTIVLEKNSGKSSVKVYEGDVKS